MAIAFLFATSSFAKSDGSNGEWIASSIVSTGVVGERYWERVSSLLGTTIKIDGSKINLSTGITCELGNPSQELWENDMATFGSFGGNWAQLGLETSENGKSFEVTNRPIRCNEADWPQLTIVTQIGNDILLLGSFRVFASFQKTTD
jgi:hypothetical protein